MSLPVWERGLKLLILQLMFSLFSVAPRVGAWIETCSKFQNFLSLLVAPRVGAWIETRGGQRAGASPQSLPVWERGLKLP